MKIALVHDNFTQLGAPERVAESLYRILPGADVITTFATTAGTPHGMRSADIQNTWMRHLPGVDRHYRHYSPLSSLAVKGLNLSGYDLVVSSSSGSAKGARVDKGAIHICYCHTPTPLVWRNEDYPCRDEFGFGQRGVRSLLLNNLRKWDRQGARQPDQYVVNSRAIAQRVWDAYGRHALVIPPPIDVHRFKVSAEQDDYYLVVSPLAGYARIDIAIEACTQLNRRLVVIGSGPDRARLEKMAGPPIEFIGDRPDDVIASYIERCRAVLLPGDEDFAPILLEANAAGRPVIAFHKGGAIETVVENTTGLFFQTPTAKSLSNAIQNLEGHSWNARTIRRHAETFDLKAFENRFMQLVSSIVPDSITTLPRLQSAIAVA